MHPHHYVNQAKGGTEGRRQVPGDRGKQRDPFPDPCTAVTRVTLRHLEGVFKNIPKPVRCNQLIKKTRVFMYMLEGWGRRRGGNEPRGSHPFRSTPVSPRCLCFSGLLPPLSVGLSLLPTWRLLPWPGPSLRFLCILQTVGLHSGVRALPPRPKVLNPHPSGPGRDGFSPVANPKLFSV